MLDQNLKQISSQQEKSIALISFKESIPEALVYDKNIGRLDIYCPNILLTIYLNISGIIKRTMLNATSTKEQSSPASKPKIRNASVTRKDKDATRIRAMVSYYHHPLKRILLLASRGLMTILKAIK